MIGRPTGRRRLHPIEPKLGQIERIDEGVDHANRIALVNEIIEAFGQQCRLLAIHTSHEALHQFPRKSRGNHIANINQRVFTHGVIPGSESH